MKVRSKAKRFFAILLSLAMVVSMMPTIAFAEVPGTAVSWTETYSGTGGFSVTVTATGDPSMTYPDDATTAGNYYEGMTLAANWSATGYTYAPNGSGSLGNGQWGVYKNDVFVNQANIGTLDGNATYTVKYNPNPTTTEVFSGGQWSNSEGKIVVPAALPVPKQTVTTLSAEQAGTSVTAADEGSTVTLTAEVKEGTNVVSEGTVTYYADNVAIGTVLAGDSFNYTMPLLDGSAKSVEFKAKYSGTETYAASQTASATTVNVNSIYIINYDAAVTATPALKMNTESTLSLTGAVKNSAGNTLSAGDYSVEFYQNTGNGVWTKMTGDTAKPLNSGYAYMARVLPAGTYTKGAFETAPIGGGDITMITPTVDVARVGSGDIYQNNSETYKATVKDGSNNVAGGTVSFYYEKDGNAVFVNTVPVVEGEASCEISFPEATTDTSKYTVKAVYSGNSIYYSGNGSVADQVVKSTTIDAAPTLDVSPALAVGSTSTLTLGGMSVYALGTDYVVVWEQNDGSGWVEFDRTVSGTDMTKAVTPDSNNLSYRAVILPTGKYTAPANGLIAGPTTTSPTKVSTTTTLSADNTAPFEDGTVTLTATVKHGTDLVSGGTVTFTLPGGATKDVAVDVTGTAVLTVPAPAAGSAVTYEAKYNGDGAVYGASAVVDVEVNSRYIEIVNGGADLSILDSVSGNAYVPDAGTAATMKLPDIYEKGKTVPLTYGTDYTVNWYVNTSGDAWSFLGSGETMAVTPEKNTDKYKAVVLPAGNYKKPLTGIEFKTAEGSLVATTTKLEKTSPTGDVYVGNTVTVKATVTYNVADPVKEGTVYFVNADTGAQLAVKKLNASGTAEYSFKVTSQDKINIRAEYSGTGKYAPSETTADLSIDPKAPEIATVGTAFSVSPALVGGKMTVNTEYTLTLPEVIDANDITVLAANKHYTVKWLSRNEDGSWSEISTSTPNSVKVTPTHDKAAYTAVVYPRYNETDGSYYVEPRDGIAMDTLTVGTKLTTATTLTTNAVGNKAFEGTTVRLTAAVKEGTNNVSGGSVTFKQDGTDIGTVAVVDGVAYFDVKMPAWIDGGTNGYTFTAAYSGTSAYNASADSTGKTVTVLSASLRLETGAKITINDGTVDPANVVVNTAYKLTAPEVYAKDDDTTPLTIGDDYVLEWQYSEDGNTWATVSGTGKDLDPAKFGNTSAAYRVIIRPAASSDYTMPSSIVVELKPASTASETTTTLTANKTEYFEGEPVILTAVVKETATGNFATGTVKFYRKNTGGDEYLGYSDLTTQGEATLTVTAPAFADGTSQQYYAEYQGNTIYLNSSSNVVTVTIKSNVIVTDSYSDSISVEYNGSAYTGNLIANRTYTLTIPKVYQKGTTTELVCGKDYKVEWQVSYNGGSTWTAVANGGDSITVTPEHENAQYRAIIRPYGNYKKANDGSNDVEELVMKQVESTVIDTVTTLTVDPASCKEGETVTLTVSVKDADDKAVKDGVVKVYLYDAADSKFIGQKSLSGLDKVEFTTEAPAYGVDNTHYYYAIYEGTSSYKTSGVKSNDPTETFVDQLTVASNKIVTKGNLKTITINPNDATLIVNKEYTLTIPNVFQQGADQAVDSNKLKCGEDYNVQWQVSYDNGETWTALANEGDSITVTPEHENAQYKALITPYGAFKKAFDGTDTVEKLTMETVTSTVVGTTTTLTVEDAAAPEGTSQTEYEGEYVTLKAAVVENNTGAAKVTSGYVYFYNDGALLNTVPVEVKDGVATLVTPMTEYSSSNTQDIFTAKYVANDRYGASEDATGVTVLIRSTKIDVPVIQALYGSTTETTSTGAVVGLPAGTPIDFSLYEDATIKVTALDGRALTAGTDYTLQWEQNSNQGMFVAIDGATATPYNLAKGENGDSFRLTLKPAGHMTVGNTSLTATIGTLSDPEVTINVTEPYPAGNGSHCGDQVAISVRIKGGAALPTGVVSFWYDADNDGLGEVQIGDYITLSKSSNPSDTNIAVAKITTTVLPQDQMKIYVKYHGDTMFQAEDTYGTNIDASAIKSDYKVWSTEIQNTDVNKKLNISVTKKNGTSVTGVTVLDAASTYELTLRTPIYTEDGQEMVSSEYEIVWQQSENGIDWIKVPGAENKTTCTVSPENDNMQYRAQVTTTYDLFAPPLATVPTRLDTELSNVLSCNPQAVTVDVTTSMANAGDPYTDSVYEGNEITLYAEVIPTDAAHTEDVGGKVEFYYSVYDNGTYGTLTAVPSSDPKDGGDNEAAVIERDGKYYAAITTKDLPAKADGKMQKVAIVAWYMGDGTYDELKPPAAVGTDRKVTVYSSTVYADNDVQNKILPDTISGGKPTEATAGIIIYAPEDVLVSDGSATVLTLKNLYTLDAQDGSNHALAATPGVYTYLTENTNYTIQWQYTTALNTANPENSSWIKLDAAGHQATVSPLAGYAYRAVITVDQSAERTVESQKTYYSNILAAEAADAVLQLRATPASSGGFKDTDLVFDAYVSGGTTVPVGNITLTLDGTLGGGVNRTATAVNGHVKFGGGIGDTAGKINLPADVYTMKASYEGNNGYKIELNEQTYIVRYKAEEVAVKVTESAYEGLIYDGTIQRPDKAAVSFNGGAGHTAAQNKADASVVFNYEMKKGDSWVAVDAPFDAGEYRVTAVLPESIYYEAQKSAPLTFSIAQREVEVDDILVQAKVYDGKTDANILDVELKNVVAGDSVYTNGAAVTAKADALVDNTVTYTATGLVGPDASNYKFKANGDSKTETFTVARNLITVDSSAITGTGLTGLKVYDNYGNEMKKGTDYTVRYFYHDGSGVKETTNLSKAGKYTVIVAPKDTANYKGGESFVMNVAADVTFVGKDSAAPAVPGIISITGTQQLWDNKSVTAEASNGSTVSVSYNVTDVDKAGRYGVTATAAGCGETHGILTVYKAEAVHIVPVVNNKVYDGAAVSVANAAEFTTPGTYFTYTGGEIIGISYDAPKDAGVYTVTAHVPATDTTVAYTETSTFEITQKPITVSAVSVTKETYRTNPALRVTYDGLVSGDSDIKDMLVLPSFNLLNTEGVNHDLNQVGDFTIVPYGIVSRNYEVVTYNNANFAVQHTDPALAMNIVGLPNGQVYYGDEFQVSLYGTVGERADGNGTYNNPSSVINYFVSDGSGGWTQDNGNVTIDNDGNVKIKGAAAADFTIKAERGTGDYKIVKTVDVKVKKRPVYISMIGEDTNVYNGAEQNLNTDKYSVTGYISPDVIKSKDCTYTYEPAVHKDVDEYQISVTYEDAKYIGTGKGLMTITPKSAVVTSNDNLANIYGQNPDVNDADYDVTGMAGAETKDDVITFAVTKSDVRFNSDVDNYEIFTAGVENKNYDVSYESGKYEVFAKALTKVAAGVDDTAVINTITTQVKRAYGVANPQMGYQVNGLIDGDSLADLLIDKNFVVYSRVQEDDANVVGSASTETVKALDTEYVNGYKIDDGYGLIDLHDSLANINSDACNYTMTPDDGLLDIYQSNITIDVQDLTVKKGTTLSDSSYYAVVYRVLTAAPMNDTLSDLRIHYTPLGIAGQAPCETGTENINATLEEGSTTLGLPGYFAQNYYALTVNKGDLTVKDKEALADISPNKDGVTVKTTVELAPVYSYDAGTSAYTKVADTYVILGDVTGTANGDGYVPVDGLTLYNDSVAAAGTAGTDIFVKSGEKVTKPVNVGYIDYIVIDKNGNKMASGQMAADGTNIGSYADNPYDTFESGLTALPNGNYNILLDPTGDYALQPTVKNFTVGGTVPSGGGGGGGSVEPPLLIKDDHFAYMQGDDYGYFRPDANLTRAEAATIFYNLLTDKSMGDMATSFTDVKSGEWYAKAINTLASRGILGGYEDGTFKPSANITRAEFAAIASRFDDLSSGTASFKDVPSIHWAYSYIVSAATKGWITGYEDGTFKPEANITRAEVVTLVNRVLERVPDKNFIDKNIDDIKVLKDVNKDHWAYYYMIEATNGHDYSKDSKGNETWSKLQ